MGGANSAGQAALHFARFARRVTLLVRAAVARGGMSAYLVDQVERTPNIDVRLGTAAGRALTATGASSTSRSSTPPARVDSLAATGMFVFIGAEPLHRLARGRGCPRRPTASCSPVPT